MIIIKIEIEKKSIIRETQQTIKQVLQKSPYLIYRYKYS